MVGLWEFVFFNKESERATNEFVAIVKAVVDEWKWGVRWDNDPEAFVSKLKALYEAQFPEGRPRNDISLVTYSGPIADTWAKCYSCTGDLYSAHRPFEWPLWWICHSCGRSGAEHKSSHLYFGDLTLRASLLKQKLRPHLGNERWSRILAIQVPHHGSKHSWFRNASTRFFHESSIFSYGMWNSYGHPGRIVLDDLNCRRPMLVNEFQGALFCGHLAPKVVPAGNQAQ